MNLMELWIITVCCIAAVVVICAALQSRQRIANRLSEGFSGQTGQTGQTGQAQAQSCVYDQEDAKITSGNRVVMYYAPWCVQSTAFRPDFDHAASQALSSGLDVCFLTVNSDKQPTGSTCLKEKGVIIFPTIRMAKTSGPDSLYTGLRNAADLLAWVKAKISLP